VLFLEEAHRLRRRVTVRLVRRVRRQLLLEASRLVGWDSDSLFVEQEV